MSNQWSRRPSELLGLVRRDDQYAAWCLDEVVYFFGNWVESQVNEAITQSKDKAQATRMAESTLRACLAEIEETATATTGKFKDPMASLNGN
jgi:hypothetical protein